MPKAKNTSKKKHDTKTTPKKKTTKTIAKVSKETKPVEKKTKNKVNINAAENFDVKKVTNNDIKKQNALIIIFIFIIIICLIAIFLMNYDNIFNNLN